MGERNLNFDEVINRFNTDCIKYDEITQKGMPRDVLPLWVADMDFKTSSYIEDALIERVKYPVFGYSEPGKDYYEAVRGWMIKHHNYAPKDEWFVKTPGVVFALATAVKAFTKPGDNILLQRPVYYPFTNVIENNGRHAISSDLMLSDDNRYYIDYEDFERKIVDYNVKMFLLCNPHNPVGRIWNKEELTRLGNICLKHNVIVVSDEIHSDFVFAGEHTVFAGICSEFEQISVTCTAPSKTFNLASMLVSNIFIANEKLRKAFEQQVEASGMAPLSILGIVATKAAYSQGEEWYEAMMKYVRGNIEFVRDYVKTNLPEVETLEHEGTYLVWLDFRKTGLTSEQIDDKMLNEAKVWLDGGSMFGDAGRSFQRINVACPRVILEEALERIRHAFAK